jgi:simple sugar transport system ATP-binding protein
LSRTDLAGPADAPDDATAPAVSLRGVSMGFSGKTVLESVSLDVAPGTVLALLGANGAGKSTLIKVLSGVYPEHGGQVLVGSAPVTLRTPIEAQRLGIQTVHQRVGEGILPGLSVAENLAFGRLAERSKNPFVGTRATLEHARQVQSALELDWSDSVLRRDVDELGISDQQLLVLARALATRPRLLILDEPTSALSAAEAERLFAIIEGMRRKGIAVLYVSHRLGEIDALADRLVVLRDGNLADHQEKPFDWETALRAMLAPGDGVDEDRGAVELRPETELRGERVAVSLRGVPLLPGRAPQDLDLHAGEVTGVVGLLGAGKSELARGLFGADRFEAGTIELDGAAYRPKSPRDAIRQRVFLVPEDRHADALIPGWSLAQNLSLPFLSSFSRGGLLRTAAEADLGRRTIEGLGIVTRDEESLIEELSGGNQQKVVVGRWMVEPPRVLLLDEPFRGVDIGARRDIGKRARQLAAKGAAVVVLSADVDEVLESADRVLVLAEGVIRLDVRRRDAGRDAVIRAISQSSESTEGP